MFTTLLETLRIIIGSIAVVLATLALGFVAWLILQVAIAVGTALISFVITAAVFVVILMIAGEIPL